MFKRIALAALSATMGPVVIIAVMGLRLEAQIAPPAANSPTFEAASIRPAATAARITSFADASVASDLPSSWAFDCHASWTSERLKSTS